VGRLAAKFQQRHLHAVLALVERLGDELVDERTELRLRVVDLDFDLTSESIGSEPGKDAIRSSFPS